MSRHGVYSTCKQSCNFLPSVAHALEEVRRRWCPGREAEVAFGSGFMALIEAPGQDRSLAVAEFRRELGAHDVDVLTARELAEYLLQITEEAA